MQSVADLARSVIGARYAALGLLSPDRRGLQLFVTSGLSPEARAALGAPPKGHGILGVVIREGRPIRLPDLAQHPDSAGFPPGHPPMHSFLGGPITGQSEVLGNLYLTEKEGGGHFTDEDEHLTVLLASLAASAMENARNHEESARLIGEVQALMRSRERFFAMINHELRNAIAGVLGWAELLVRRKDPASVPRAAREVFEAAESAAELIRDLHDLSRLDEDRLKPVLAPVDSRAVIRRAVARVTPMATTRDVRLSHTETGNLPVLNTDASRVEQILVNLLNNAIRHSHKGGEIEVVAGIREERFVVEVRDEGPGVAPDQLPHVFDVYYTKPGPDGMGVGLGLPLARRLALLLNGDLLTGNRPTGGAVFTLELPA
jgi:signal transduction histidine kinase